MSRNFHVQENNETLRCLIKAKYVSLRSGAKGEDFYVLDKTRLNDLIRFMSLGDGLESVIRCVGGQKLGAAVSS